MSADETEMLALFVQEASEHLETLETDLVRLEATPNDAALLNRLFRAVHSIKGTAGFFGLTAITDLAHLMESVMALLRDGRLYADRQLINLFLGSTDHLRVMVGAPERAPEVDTRQERAALAARLDFEAPVKPATGALPVLPAYLRGISIDPELVRSSLCNGQHLYVIELQLKADIEAAGQTLLDYFRDVESLGLLIAAATTLSEGDLSEAVASELTCTLLFATAMEPDLLQSAFNLPADRLICSPKAVWTEWLATQPSLVPAASFALSTPPRPAAEVTPPPQKNHHEHSFNCASAGRSGLRRWPRRPRQDRGYRPHFRFPARRPDEPGRRDGAGA